MTAPIDLPPLPNRGPGIGRVMSGPVTAGGGPSGAEPDEFSRSDMIAFGLECTRLERERAAKICEPTSSALLLIAGEMSADELRCVQAVLKSRATVIRKG